MRAIRIFSASLVLLLLLVSFPAQVGSDEGRKVKLTGLVASVEAGGGSFQLRDLARELYWTVVLHREAKIEAEGDDKLRVVSTGDVVQVEGTRLGSQAVLAKKVKVLGHTGAQFPPAQPAQPQQGQRPPAPGGTANSVATLVKTLGVGVAVKVFAEPLNTFINKLLQAKDAQTQQVTKVVPILSITIGVNVPGKASIGAAQVTGSKPQVDKVQAVAAIDGNFQDVFGIRALIPVDSLEPWKQLRRVVGVGVSAIIDLRI